MILETRLTISLETAIGLLAEVGFGDEWLRPSGLSTKFWL